MSRHCLETFMISLENGVERKNIIYNSYNGLQSYVSVCIKYMYLYIDRWWHWDVDSSLIGWHKMSHSGMNYLLPSVMCSMKLAWEFHFPNNTDMSQIICICMLLITTFLCSQLPPYCLLCVLVLSMQIPYQIQHLQLFVICHLISTGPME